LCHLSPLALSWVVAFHSAEVGHDVEATDAEQAALQILNGTVEAALGQLRQVTPHIDRGVVVLSMVVLHVVGASSPHDIDVVVQRHGIKPATGVLHRQTAS
jgi:hypothetical protein